MGNKPSNNGTASSSNAVVDRGLQRRIIASKRLQQEMHNIKIVVRGERRTGKSSLIERLRGGGFSEEYVATPEIAAAHVNWNYKCSDAAVKVEVWDVVNEAIDGRDERLAALQTGVDAANEDLDAPAGIASASSPIPGSRFRGHHSLGLLDATTVDVYKNCDAVVFMIDPRSRSSFEFVVREVQNVPRSATLLILRNFVDLVSGDSENEEIVPREAVTSIVESLRTMREEEQKEFELPPGKVDGFDACMKNCFGLKVLHSYLNIPFLRLRWKTLRRKLQECIDEHDSAMEEVEMYIQTQNYDQFAARAASLIVASTPDRTRAEKVRVPASAPERASRRTSLCAPSQIPRKGAASVFLLTERRRGQQSLAKS